ncbi:hypothetical protein ES332_D13G108500v1 [Gossypium tomentosum]|uniref:Uncharacterized protein n=1 Tax=Gossypium tomentosum TaxID=34277 RepID=A0A5D2HVN0_GOSTO|nr:hypothetical protein ES332_D13G108500v1 [Gossypium tomentosum]
MAASFSSTRALTLASATVLMPPIPIQTLIATKRRGFDGADIRYKLGGDARAQRCSTRRGLGLVVQRQKVVVAARVFFRLEMGL